MMALSLRVFLMAVSVLTSLYISFKIRRAQVRLEDSVFWFLLSLSLIIISIFPQIAEAVSNLIGVESPANLIFLTVISILFYKVFSLSMRISVLEHKLKTVVQEFAVHGCVSRDKEGLEWETAP